jgi:hypothetical protein
MSLMRFGLVLAAKLIIVTRRWALTFLALLLSVRLAGVIIWTVSVSGWRLLLRFVLVFGPLRLLGLPIWLVSVHSVRLSRPRIVVLMPWRFLDAWWFLQVALFWLLACVCRRVFRLLVAVCSFILRCSMLSLVLVWSVVLRWLGLWSVSGLTLSRGFCRSSMSAIGAHPFCTAYGKVR